MANQFDGTTSATAGATLTAEAVLKMARDLEAMMPKRPSLFDPLYPFPKLGGMDVFIEPEVPKIQARDIKLSDGTSILSPEFRAELNTWFAARFGYREGLCKDRALLLGNYGVMVDRRGYNALLAMTT